MNEKFRAKEVLLLLAAASCLRIPIEFLTLNAEKKVVARTPFISFAGQYLSPGQSLELVDENLRVSVNAIWQKLISKVDTLLNPYTPFDAYREAHDDVLEEYSAGLDLSRVFPDCQIVLPPGIGFIPFFTTVKSSLNLIQLNQWEPDPHNHMRINYFTVALKPVQGVLQHFTFSNSA